MLTPSAKKIFSPSLPLERQDEGRELLKKFQATKTKIAIQKDGALTDIARSLLFDTYSVVVPPTPKGRIPFAVSGDGETGFIYARNKNICSLVTEGAADMAIIGTDRLIEEEAEQSVAIVASYRDRYVWSLVLATPYLRNVRSPEQIMRVATQYPVATRRYFKNMGLDTIEIVATHGGTEMYPYLEYGNNRIDAIVDLTVTGESLAAHDMVSWTPAIGEVYPVLIQKR